MKPIKLPYDLEARSLTGEQSLFAKLVYRDCKIWVGKRKLLTDLMGLDIKEYNIILRIDWLARYHTQLNCKTKNDTVVHSRRGNPKIECMG